MAVCLIMQFASNTKPSWCPSHFGAKWAGLARPFRYVGCSIVFSFLSCGVVSISAQAYLSSVVALNLLEMKLLGLTWVLPTLVLL